MKTYYTVKKGSGRTVQIGDFVNIHYRIFVCPEDRDSCGDGCCGPALDDGEPKTASFIVGTRVVHAPIDENIVGMEYGGCKRLIYVPAEKAFAEKEIVRHGKTIIPSNTSLCVEIEVREETIN